MPETRIAWNGLEMTMAEPFEVAALGRYSLRAACGGGTLELSWKPVEGRFDLADQFTRVQKAASGQLTAAEASAPMAANHPGWLLQGFSWSDKGQAGHGLLGWDPAAKMTLLATWNAQEPAARFRFALPDAQAARPWAIYDLRAEVPGHLEFNAWVFQPGLYRLTFVAGREKLVLHRLAPADVLLAGNSLRQWSADHFSKAIAELRWAAADCRVQGAEAVAWEAAPQGGLSGLWGRIVGRGGWSGLTAWRPAGANRLLAVEAYAPQRPLWLDRVLEGYASVVETP